MDLLFRVLNDYDIACNPLMNGLASKKLIYDLTLSYLESNEKQFMAKLDDTEKDIYCRENMMKYIITHQHKLKKMIDKRGNQISRNLALVSCYDVESWTYLLYYLSTLNTHLSNGFRIDTDWISTTKKFNSIFKYYKNQKEHKVAVLASCSGGILDDYNSLVVDLSSRQMVEDSLLFLNKKISEVSVRNVIEKVKNGSSTFLDVINNDVFVKTSEKFVGFNYSVCDNETCIYRFYPSERVIAVLESLQIDLLIFKIFSNDFFFLDKEKQILELKRLKEELKKLVIKQNNPDMFYIFKELYLENKNIDFVLCDGFDMDKINYNRKQILKLAKCINNVQIKK